MTNNKNFILGLSIIITSYFIFFLGFIFDENSSGGGRIDFEHTLSTINVFKEGILNALSDTRYESSRPPLFAILNILNPFNYSDNSLRISNLVFNSLIPIFFYILIKKQNNFNKYVALTVTSLVLLSPYFRTTSYWVLEENLPFLFFFITLIILPRKKVSYKNIILVAFFSSLSVYSDQKFIFLSLFTYLYFLRFKNNFKDFIYISLVYFLTAIPYFYLVYLWNGITPPQASFRFNLVLENISYIASIINFYFIPLFLFLLLDNQLTSVIKNIKKKDFLVLILIVILNIILLPNFSSLWGNGVISKVSYYLINIIDVNTYVVQIFYLIYNCFFNFFIYLILSKSIKNFFSFLIIFVQSSYIQVVHQEYIDPLFYLLIFTYFEYDKIDMFKNKLVYIYFLFSFAFLIFANIYYGLILNL